MNILTVNHLTKRFGSHTVVDSIHFTLQANKCIALIGPNGAGKTTVLRIITGLMKKSAGTIQIMGDEKIVDFRPFLGYLPQHPVFNNWMTGKQYLIYCARLTNMNKQEAEKRADLLLEKVGLKDAKNKRISTYSGGMKQRLGIAQAIIHQPKLLILDEPVSALDPIGRREVLNLMEELKQKMTVLFSTHILSDADEISDELLLLDQGKLIESGDIESLRKKYKTTKISLQFEEDPASFANKLNSLQTVTNTSISRSTLHLTVTNIETAREEILQTVAENRWPLTNFSVNRVSLEDMFMKAVQ